MRKSLAIMIMILTVVTFSYAETNTSSSSEEPKFGFGFSFGTVVINGITYFQIKGQPDFSFGKLGVGLDINLEFDGNWNLRTSEWNSWQAILSKIRYLRWGFKGEKPIYFKIGQIEDATIGHGFIMQNYANNLNYPSVKKFGISFDLDLDYVGFESFVDNIFDFDIIGLRGFVRPLYGAQIFLLDNIEIGASIVADIDPFNPAPPTNSPYEFSDNEASKGREIYIAGADLGLPIIKLDPVFNMNWYADFAYIFNKGTGESTGLYGSILSFLPYRFEIRYLQPKFLPSFFDALYEAERYISFSNTYISKYDLLDGITNSYFGWFFSSGVSFEKVISLTVNIQDSFDDTTYPEMRLTFHLDKELTKIIAFDFNYYRKNIREFKDIYTTESTDATINTRLYYKVSDMVGIVVNYTRTFGWFEENGQMTLKPLESTTISTEISF